MAAAHVVVAVTEPEYDSVEAAIRSRDFIAQWAADLANPDLALVGVVVNTAPRRRQTRRPGSWSGGPAPRRIRAVPPFP